MNDETVPRDITFEMIGIVEAARLTIEQLGLKSAALTEVKAISFKLLNKNIIQVIK